MKTPNYYRSLLSCDQKVSMAKFEKEEIAEYYYINGRHSMKDISAKVAVSVQTLSRWKKKYKWDEIKKSHLVTKPEQLANLYEQLSELTDKIKGRPKGERYADSKEADSLAKITSSIKNLEKEISTTDTLNVFYEFNNWLRETDLDKAKDLIDIQDTYIKTLL